MIEVTQMTFGTCMHCGKKPATRMPLKLCAECSDELFYLPNGKSPERQAWFNNSHEKR